MRRIVFILIFGLVSTMVHAQMYRYNTKFSVSAQHFVDTIPIEFENNQVYIRALVDGIERRFCLDTGSSQGILYRNSSIVYRRIMGNQVSTDANGRRDTILAVQFPDIRLGNLTLRGYVGSLLRQPVGNEKYDAVIGFDLFNKGLSAKIDTRNKVMILTDRRDLFLDETGFPIKYRLLRFVPNVKLSPYPHCMDEAKFDTGSRRLYVMARRSLKVFTQRFPDIQSQVEGVSYGSRAIGNFGAERAGEVTFLWLDEVNMGGYSFLDYHTMTTEGNSRIGAELLNYGTILILPHKKELLFQPYDNNDRVMVSNKQTDIAFIPQNNRAAVGLIWEGSEHYQNGFRQGDIIISIDGKPINSFYQFLKFPFVEDREYLFVVQDTTGNLHHIKSRR